MWEGRNGVTKMGLDFSHGEAHWAYSSFNRFRERLAQIAGFNLRDMQGFTDPPVIGKDWDNITDPIKDLLNHSDCDGELTPTQCVTIIPRLGKMIKGWEDDDYDKQNASNLINGMKEAIKEQENLEFR